MKGAKWVHMKQVVSNQGRENKYIRPQTPLELEPGGVGEESASQ